MSDESTLTVGSAPFAIVPAEAFRDARLSLRDIQVLGLVCSHLNKDRICWPSQSRLAKMARVSRTVVCRSLQRLNSCGYLIQEEQYREDGSRGTNIIRVLFYRIEAKELADAAEVPIEMESASDTPPVHNWRTGPVRPERTPPVTSGRTPITVPIEQNSIPPPTPPRKVTAPPELDTELWEQWEQHRRALRKPLTPQARALQWQKLAEWGWEHQREIIERSIERGWQGLFPPDREQPGKRESVLERVQRQTLAKHSRRSAAEAELTKLLGGPDGR